MATRAALSAGNAADQRYLMHLPWVRDRARMTDPSTLVVVFSGVDSDHPPDGEDDFSGEEIFFAAGTSLDACGEPRYYSDSATLDHGGAFRSLVENPPGRGNLRGRLADNPSIPLPG